MFIDIKRYILNTDHIAYIDKAEKSWTVHLSNGEKLTVDADWLPELRKFLKSEPSPH